MALVQKFVTRILFHYENISPLKHFLMQTFRIGAQTHGVNISTWWEGELKSAASDNYKCEGITSTYGTMKSLAALFFQ